LIGEIVQVRPAPPSLLIGSVDGIAQHTPEHRPALAAQGEVMLAQPAEIVAVAVQVGTDHQSPALEQPLPAPHDFLPQGVSTGKGGKDLFFPLLLEILNVTAPRHKAMASEHPAPC